MDLTFPEKSLVADHLEEAEKFIEQITKYLETNKE
jgi:hypothetical protein